MGRPYDVLSEGRWPSGEQKAAAVLRVDVSSLSDRIGSDFQAGLDDLGAFRQLGLRLRSGRLVLLTRHEEEPTAGATVWIDSEDDALSALGELADCLRLSEADVEWMSTVDGPLTTETYLLQDLLAELLERGRDAASAARTGDASTSDGAFAKGVAQGYYEVLSHTLGQLEAFGIDQRRVGWTEKVDLERELLP